MPVSEVSRAHVLAVLEPIWTSKNETASRVRGRLEKVLDYAKAKDWRTGDNPAAWAGHLEAILPARGAVRAVQHHTAMPHADVPAFIARLRSEHGTGARALEFTILTAARTGEAIGALWTEIDLGAATWTIPAARMKAKREHKVPLSARAMEIVRQMARERMGDSPYLFPGYSKQAKPLSNMAFLMLLKRMRVDVTAHGFRSAFRDWAGDETQAPREVAEACLAHTVRDRTEAAYRRGDALAKRRKLLDAWAAFLEPPSP